MDCELLQEVCVGPGLANPLRAIACPSVQIACQGNTGVVFGLVSFSLSPSPSHLVGIHFKVSRRGAS